jgi:uncharacterized membrane protein
MATASNVFVPIVQCRNPIQTLYGLHAETAFPFSPSIGKSAVTKPKLFRNTFQKTSREMQMTNTKILVSSALSALATLATTAAIAKSASVKKPNFVFKKQYGFVNAGLNDCQTSSQSRAGTSNANNQAGSWIYMPAGTCSKLIGGRTTPNA